MSTPTTIAAPKPLPKSDEATGAAVALPAPKAKDGGATSKKETLSQDVSKHYAPYLRKIPQCSNPNLQPIPNPNPNPDSKPNPNPNPIPYPNLNLRKILQNVSRSSGQGLEPVVLLTCGRFTPVHAGHIRMQQEAAAFLATHMKVVFLRPDPPERFMALAYFITFL